VGDFITNDNTLIFSGKESGINTLGVWISGGIYGTGNGGKGTLIGTVSTNSSQNNSNWSFNYAGSEPGDKEKRAARAGWPALAKGNRDRGCHALAGQF
jgi:hypothetical protein